MFYLNMRDYTNYSLVCLWSVIDCDVHMDHLRYLSIQVAKKAPINTLARSKYIQNTVYVQAYALYHNANMKCSLKTYVGLKYIYYIFVQKEMIIKIEMLQDILE